jgi:hypothetical protein
MNASRLEGAVVHRKFALVGFASSGNYSVEKVPPREISRTSNGHAKGADGIIATMNVILHWLGSIKKIY